MKRESTFILMVLWLAVFVLTSCTGSEPPAGEPAAVNSTAEPTVRPTVDLDDPAVQDALQYAEDMGISPEEAVSRMEVQQALGDSGLESALMANEADTFAGLWLQYEPEYRVVVAFTRDGEETIQPYVEDESFADFVDVRNDYRYTLAELQEAQQQGMQTLQDLGIAASSGIDVQENEVTLTVGNPALLQEELEAAGLALPEPVVVEAIDPDNLSDALRGGVTTYEGPEGQPIYLPRQAPTEVYLEAEVDGRLILDENGCLRLEDERSDEQRLILWHAGHSLRFGDGIEVLNDSGEVIARVGEEIYGGGGYLDSQAPAIPGMPIDACPGPYILLGMLPPL